MSVWVVFKIDPHLVSDVPPVTPIEERDVWDVRSIHQLKSVGGKPKITPLDLLGTGGDEERRLVPEEGTVWGSVMSSSVRKGQGMTAIDDAGDGKAYSFAFGAVICGDAFGTVICGDGNAVGSSAFVTRMYGDGDAVVTGSIEGGAIDGTPCGDGNGAIDRTVR